MLIKLNNDTNSSELDSILDSNLTIFEDVQGSKVLVNWDGGNFSIRPKSMKSEPITILDLATQKYYNKCINFFYQLPERITMLMPKKWSFCFEYFPDNEPANIKYDRVPKNNLILTAIIKNDMYVSDIDELIEYANLFKCDYLPVIFSGTLNEIQKTAIKYFVNTSPEDLEYVFGEKNFAYFFYKLLNPFYDNSFLMDTDFQYNIQRLLIKTDANINTFEILNPMYSKISQDNHTEYTEIYSLILINFMSFIQNIDVNSIKLKSKRQDLLYIELISTLYNSYMLQNSEYILNFDIIIPTFFNKDKFKINTKLIESPITRQYILQDEKFEYIFKCILGSFNKVKKKPIGIFTDKTVTLFNTMVNDIKSHINVQLNILSDKELRLSGLVDFGDFYQIKYDTDADGNVYPSVDDEFKLNTLPNNKFKKGMKGDDKKL